MFSGIGGFEHGIGGRLECIGYSEIDPYAMRIYERHFPDHVNYGDAREIDTETLPDFDLLVGGFPCQAFSVAGKQRGFCDARGTLFFEIARILTEKRPRYILLENVKGLLSHEKGETFQIMLGILTDLGYRIQWQVLNSKDFGVPQNRERVFIVGHLGRRGGREIFPITRGNGQNIRKIVNTGHDGTNIYSPKGIAVTQKALGGGQGAKTGLYAVKDNISTCIDANYWKGLDHHQQRTGVVVPVLTPDRLVKKQNGRRFKEDGDPSYTLTSQDKHGIFDGYRIRRLTPRECERLQGFPDDYTKFDIDDDVISDSQRYKCIGNAVTTNVISAIIERMFTT